VSRREAPKSARRRRGRELALQALFSLDLPAAQAAAALAPTMHRVRERALAAEAQLVFADGRPEEAREAVEWLLRLDPQHVEGQALLAALSGTGPAPLALEEVERAERDAVRGTNDELTFTERIVRGVVQHRDGIDQRITDSSTNWRVQRMALVDRNILRIAVYELVYLPEIPPRVILNEAIEIAKRYGTADSGAFINGILDRIANQVRGLGQLAAGHGATPDEAGADGSDNDAGSHDGAPPPSDPSDAAV
jgi:N utilization substance protein B